KHSTHRRNRGARHWVLAMNGNFRTKLVSGLKRACGYTAARRLIVDKDASATVEFGLIAAPFLAMVFAIMETAIVFFAGQALGTAAYDSARLNMTGQAQTAGYNQAAFKTAVCNKIYGLFNCAANMYVDVKSYTTFASINTSKPIANGTFDSSNFGYTPGGP